MQCPICASEALVWDYEHGYIVCTNCGTVVETLYEEFYYAEPVRYTVKNGLPTVREGFVKKKQREQGLRLRTRSKEVKLFETYIKRARKGVTVDLEALKQLLTMGTTNKRIYVHTTEPKLRELMTQDHELSSLIALIERDPLLSSRTLRGKVAIALMLKYLLHGLEPDFDYISNVTSLSRTHVRRLYRQLSQRLNRIAMRIRIHG